MGDLEFGVWNLDFLLMGGLVNLGFVDLLLDISGVGQVGDFYELFGSYSVISEVFGDPSLYPIYSGARQRIFGHDVGELYRIKALAGGIEKGGEGHVLPF